MSRPMHSLTRRSGGHARTGASIIELLIAMTLLSVIMTSVLAVLSRQQRFFTASSSILSMRAQLQGTAAILPMDLRALSATAKDPVTGNARPDIVNGSPLSDSAEKRLDLRVTLGSAIACRVTGAEVVVPSDGTLSSGAVLTNWTSPPAVGDTIYILDEGITPAVNDDQWHPREIAAVTRNTANECPTVSTTPGTKTFGPFTSTADAARRSWTLSLGTTSVGPLPATVEIGAPIRLVRRVRYELYQAADQEWYLGFCEGTKCTEVNPYQPLAGPLRPYVSPRHDNNGLRFTFYDTTGNETQTPQTVSRVDISIRGITGRKVNFAGGSTADFVSDTLRLSVALRNRN